MGNVPGSCSRAPAKRLDPTPEFCYHAFRERTRILSRG
jgi:hypothetical protein